MTIGKVRVHARRLQQNEGKTKALAADFSPPASIRFYQSHQGPPDDERKA
jgi:hypothetical protein